jgi:hypothetical protein
VLVSPVSQKNVPGGLAGGATPVPIPNTEVKPSKADDTAAVRQWESRTLPGYKKSLLEQSSRLFSFVPRQRPKESRSVLSGDVDYDKAMNSRRHEQAWFGPLPGYNKGPLVERSAGLFFCLMEQRVCQGSAAPTPLGAILPDSLGGSLLEFLQLRSRDAASHSSRLAILAQRRDAQALISRARCLS